MTHKVLTSTLIGRDFKKEVESYLNELASWKKHDEMVKRDEACLQKGDNINPLLLHKPYPQPTARADVVTSVNTDKNGNLVADYEIVDDSPSASELLRRKKEGLFNQISIAEREASFSVLPPSKRRLHIIRKNDLLLIENPTPAEKKELEEREAIDNRLSRIDRIAAQAHSDVEDLTTKNIDKWLMPSFEV